jgi:hypothetical protein
MGRTAFVAVSCAETDAPRLARLEPDVMIAPPELAAALGRPAIWFTGELAAPVPQLLPGLRALRALEMTGELDEIHCNAEGAWAIAAAARTGGLRAKVVVAISAADQRLLRPAALGERLGDILQREALLQGLRDAGEVHGQLDGVPLAVPHEKPAWESPPGVTAVVTHRDLQRYLPACLASLRAQTVPVEILVVDDGSGPDGLSALDREERKDPALRVVRRQHQGLSAARNFGVEAARTELVLIVDADNLMRPRMVERLLSALRLRPTAAAATCGFRAFDDATGSTLWHYSPAELSPRALFLANVCGDACALHRRDSLLAAGGYQQGDEFSEDWDLWLRYADRGMTTAPVHEPLFDYRIRPDSKLRTHSLLSEAAMPFKLLLLHPELAARHARELAVLAASELAAIHAGARASADAARQSREQAAAEAERAAARWELTSAQAAASAARAELAESAAAQAQAEREAAERDRAAALAELSAARRELQLRNEQLDDMASSSAVRLARTLRGSSPLAHAAVARVLRLALLLKKK